MNFSRLNLDDRLPAFGVLFGPQLFRLGVFLNVAVRRIGVQYTAGPVGNVTQMAQQCSLMCVFDVGVRLASGPDRIEKIVKMIGIAAGPRLGRDLLSPHVKLSVASVSDHDRTIGPVKGDSEAGVVRPQW